MKKYGGNISNPVLIKVPGSKGQWKMGLTHPDENGDAWLFKGWSEFAEHYGLEEGQSLFFKYKGHSEFKVVIIGKCGFEIDYPNMPRRSQEFNDSDVEINPEEDDDEELTLPRKRMNKNPSGPFFSPQETHSEDDGFSYGSLSVSDKAKALSRTRDFKSQNPFFKVVILETHLHGHHELIISPDFWLEHLNDKPAGTLYIPTGVKWPVNISTTNIGTIEVRASFERSGWKEFADKNDLQIGDVCIFELMTRGGALMKVSIYRNSPNSQGWPLNI